VAALEPIRSPGDGSAYRYGLLPSTTRQRPIDRPLDLLESSYTQPEPPGNPCDGGVGDRDLAMGVGQLQLQPHALGVLDGERLLKLLDLALELSGIPHGNPPPRPPTGIAI